MPCRIKNAQKKEPRKRLLFYVSAAAMTLYSFLWMYLSVWRVTHWYGYLLIRQFTHTDGSSLIFKEAPDAHKRRGLSNNGVFRLLR